MSSKIILREFQKEDGKAVKDMIREAWHYDKFSSPRVADKMAQVFLNSCLSSQTYTQVALLNEIPIGIIMGKNIKTHKCPLKFQLQLLRSVFFLYLNKEGQRIAKMFKNIRNIDKQLLSKCQKDYHGEIVFFVVSSLARGTGVGKILFHSLLNYMKSQSIDNFYLYTDTSCNFGFYEHQGMKRLCEMESEFIIKNRKEKMTFFIYDYHIETP